MYKKLLFVWVVVCVAVPVAAQVFPNRQYLDVVRIVDGSVLRGEIVENVPDRYLVIATADGNSFTIAAEQIDAIDREANPDYDPQIIRLDAATAEALLASNERPVTDDSFDGSWGPSLVEGDHRLGFHLAPTFVWFSGDDWNGESFSPFFPGDPDEVSASSDVGVFYHGQWPAFRGAFDSSLIGVHAAVEFAERRGTTVDDSPFGTGERIADSLVKMVHFPVELTLGFGVPRAVWYLGVGLGLYARLEGPQFDVSYTDSDETIGEDYGSTDITYSLALGGVLQIGRRWVFEPRLFFNGMTYILFDSEYHISHHAAGVSFGFARRLGVKR